MTDCELLVLAAKAAGLGYDDGNFAAPEEDLGGWGMVACLGLFWNPLTDDGDALRLAVKLRLELKVVDYGATVRSLEKRQWSAYEAHLHGGIEAATRRAIVRAAAEIGAPGNDKQKGE